MRLYERVRKTMATFIAQNPCTVIAWIRPTRDNGYGKQIPDIDEAAVETTLGVARVSRRRLPDPIVTNASTPYDYLDVYYLLVSYDADWLRKGLVFAYHNQKFRTLLPEDRIMEGAIAYRLCGLEQVTSADVEDF